MKTPTLKLPALRLPQFKMPALPGLALRVPPFLIAGKKRRILVAEMGEEWMKVAACLEDGKKKKVKFISAFPLKDVSETALAQKINELLQSQTFKPTDVLITEPTNRLTIRLLMLPSTEPREIKDILELQAVKQTPYSREEITTGFHIIGHDGGGYSRVLLAIAHRDVVSRDFRILETAKLAAGRVAPSLEGIQNWYCHVEAKQAEAETESKTILLLDVDWNFSELLILTDRRLIFNRSLSIGAKHIKEQGLVMEGELLREVQRSMESAQPELKEHKITQVVLTGTSAPQKNLLALLSRELNMPCEIVPVFRNFEEIIPAAQMDSVKDLPLSFASLLGQLLNPASTGINLLPAEIMVRKTLEEHARDLALLGTLLLGLMMLISAVSFEKIYKRGAYRKMLETEYDSIRREAGEVERLVAKMRLAQEQRGSGEGFLDVLHGINAVIPNDIYLTSFQYEDKDKQLVIRGISESEMPAVFQFVAALEGTDHLKSVKARNVSKKKVDNIDVSEFEIIAGIGKGSASQASAAAEAVPVEKEETGASSASSG